MYPKKSLSQNFLIDKNICKKIIYNSKVNNKNIIEIGPGHGVLTDIILDQKPSKLYLIEKDNYLSSNLREKYKKYDHVIIINKDILKIDINKFNKLNIISNLPYNVSTKIIMYLFNNNNDVIDEMTFMIQKEVALKFDYNLPKMNKYKLYTKLFSLYNRCFDVSPKVFKPKPKVNSSVVKFKFNKKKYDMLKLENFSKIIFMNMRKKINNKFKNKVNNSYFTNKRVDELSIDELLEIYYSF